MAFPLFRIIVSMTQKRKLEHDTWRESVEETWTRDQAGGQRLPCASPQPTEGMTSLFIIVHLFIDLFNVLFFSNYYILHHWTKEIHQIAFCCNYLISSFIFWNTLPVLSLLSCNTQINMYEIGYIRMQSFNFIVKMFFVFLNWFFKRRIWCCPETWK
jgi:hypothetical protein